MKTYWEDVLLENNQIYIVGAQSRAKAVTGYIRELFPNTEIMAYLVDHYENNDAAIQGVPVCLINDLQVCHTSFPVFIATKGIYHVQIRKSLSEAGFQIIVPVTPDIDTWFRNAYVRKIFGQRHRSFVRLDELALQHSYKDRKNNLEACVYMAQSIYDKPLNNTYVCPAYEKPIQVGAALTSIRLEPEMLRDCEGENISAKNRQYSELTGLYWIWKHSDKEVIGLSHYRRHFILSDDWLQLMNYYDIDVILPVPAYIAPSIEQNYKERHDASDWEYLMEYLKKSNASDYELAKRVFAGNLYLTCNMLIARRNVLHQLCEWLFPILDAVTLHGGEKDDIYGNRYPGFISERLFTLFFEQNQHKYKIVYADKQFIS